MAARYALSLLCLVAIALFSVMSRKLWMCEGLEFISGSHFAGKDELSLPYQKRLARECAALLLTRNLFLVLLALGILCSADIRNLLLMTDLHYGAGAGMHCDKGSRQQSRQGRSGGSRSAGKGVARQRLRLRRREEGQDGPVRGFRPRNGDLPGHMHRAVPARIHKIGLDKALTV